MMRGTLSLLSTLGFMLVLALSVGGVASSTPGLAHEGEAHGDAATPPADLAGVLTRAVATGSAFQLVGLPTADSLAIFVDTVESNLPVTGAYVEILAGDDANIVAEEVLPGLYLAAPWPPVGMDSDSVSGTEMVVTIVADTADELLLVTFPSNDAGAATSGQNPDAAPNKTGTKSATLVAGKDSGLRSWLPIVGGIITVAGAIAGFRNRGPGRWIGFSAIAIGLVMGFSTSGLL